MRACGPRAKEDDMKRRVMWDDWLDGNDVVQSSREERRTEKVETRTRHEDIRAGFFTEAIA